jgi:hypothetical protein
MDGHTETTNNYAQYYQPSDALGVSTFATLLKGDVVQEREFILSDSDYVRLSKVLLLWTGEAPRDETANSTAQFCAPFLSVTQEALEYAKTVGMAYPVIRQIGTLVGGALGANGPDRVRVDLVRDRESDEMSALVFRIAVRGLIEDVLAAEDAINSVLFDEVPPEVRMHLAFDYQLIP